MKHKIQQRLNQYMTSYYLHRMGHSENQINPYFSIWLDKQAEKGITRSFGDNIAAWAQDEYGIQFDWKNNRVDIIDEEKAILFKLRHL